MPTAVLIATMLLQASPGASFYPLRPGDSRAALLTAARGNGVADETDAIQVAIDRVEGPGVVLVPEGRYRLTRTVTVPPGVRLIGFGAHRPAFVLGDRTPGYQDAEKYMVFFAGRRAPGQPAVPEGAGRRLRRPE